MLMGSAAAGVAACLATTAVYAGSKRFMQAIAMMTEDLWQLVTAR